MVELLFGWWWWAGCWAIPRYCCTQEARQKGIHMDLADTFYKALEKEAFEKVDEALGKLPSATQR
jgi:hypothetical protein